VRKTRFGLSQPGPFFRKGEEGGINVEKEGKIYPKTLLYGLARQPSTWWSPIYCGKKQFNPTVKKSESKTSVQWPTLGHFLNGLDIHLLFAFLQRGKKKRKKKRWSSAVNARRKGLNNVDAWIETSAQAIRGKGEPERKETIRESAQREQSYNIARGQFFLKKAE